MKTKTVTHKVRIISEIQFSLSELGFLRQMAEHCVQTGMKGHGACLRLIKFLDLAQIPVRGDRPIYGIFEDEDGE
jgi:hypothetical protein